MLVDRFASYCISYGVSSSVVAALHSPSPPNRRCRTLLTLKLGHSFGPLCLLVFMLHVLSVNVYSLNYLRNLLHTIRWFLSFFFCSRPTYNN